MSLTINQEEKAKLIKLFDEATQVLQESDDLRAGLRDTVKHIAEELDIKPTVLNKAIKIAYKNSLSEERDAFDDIEMILDTIKRGSAHNEEYLSGTCGSHFHIRLRNSRKN